MGIVRYGGIIILIKSELIRCVDACMGSGMLLLIYFFFFFQAEDGIRDIGVTGVQTCALPIWFNSNIIGVIKSRQFPYCNIVAKFQYYID